MIQIVAIDAVYRIWGVNRPHRLDFPQLSPTASPAISSLKQSVATVVCDSDESFTSKLASADPPLVGWRKRI
jgi:hypothetical protein